MEATARLSHLPSPLASEAAAAGRATTGGGGEAEGYDVTQIHTISEPHNHLSCSVRVQAEQRSQHKIQVLDLQHRKYLKK
jgi:hypothetical protein